MRPGAVAADLEPMLARLVRCCIAFMAVTARVRADACSHRLAVALLVVKNNSVKQHYLILF